MLSCDDVAKYFLALNDESAGDLISNLKLQKLAYYAQGFCLALYGRPLFSERIEAWQHGPVVPDLYHQYKGYGSNAIPAPEGLDYSTYSVEEQKLLDEVYEVYGQFSAWKLRNMTHDEAPWRDMKDVVNGEITHDSLREFFSTRLQ